MGNKKRRYYHASPVLFKPGDYISPNLSNYEPNFYHSTPELVYLTESHKPHYTVADKANKENWYIYEVRPLNPKRVWVQTLWDEWVTDRPCIVLKRIGSARGISRAGNTNKKSDENHFKERLKEAKNALKTEESKESYTIEWGTTPEEDIIKYQNRIKYKNPETSKALYKHYPYQGLPKK